MQNIAINHRSNCPLSIALDVIGDKWSLLIVRDMCMNKRRYADFLSSPEGIPTNILASRLRRLEETGIIEKKPYLAKPLRYEYFLTAKGADLLPVIQQLARWTHKYVPDSIAPPEWFLNTMPEDLITTE
jgi:DNA-binding HxlR family transcriptional regulator